MERKVEKVEGEFSVCKMADFSQVDSSLEFTFTGRTDEEYSLVCPTAQAPQNALEREDGWKMLRVVGVLDFSLIGVLAEISSLLAQEGIGIFVISTFCTDYILVKKEDYDRAYGVLSKSAD